MICLPKSRRLELSSWASASSKEESRHRATTQTTTSSSARRGPPVLSPRMREPGTRVLPRAGRTPQRDSLRLPDSPTSGVLLRVPLRRARGWILRHRRRPLGQDDALHAPPAPRIRHVDGQAQGALNSRADSSRDIPPPPPSHPLAIGTTCLQSPEEFKKQYQVDEVRYVEEMADCLVRDLSVTRCRQKRRGTTPR